METAGATRSNLQHSGDATGFTGVKAVFAGELRIHGNTIAGEQQRAIYLERVSKRASVESTEIAGNHFETNEIAIALAESHSLRIHDNTGKANKSFVRQASSSHVFFENNTIDGAEQGILLVDSSDNVIGPGNSIFGFGEGGVVIIGSSVRNTVTRNSIFDNAGLGIDLGGDGVTANDAGDADTGANDLLNFPEITVNTGTVVAGKTCPLCTVEVFDTSSAPDPSGFGEGPLFVGAVQADPNGDWSVPISVTLATATATDSLGNTSEFACNVPVSGVCQPVPVGGTVELLGGASDPAARPTSGSGPVVPYAATLGSAAAALAIAGGGWYARRRFRRGRS